MNDVLFVIGAGASVHTGVPTMPHFLDRARDLFVSRQVEDARPQFERVFRGIGALQQVHSKANVDIHNVESVFSAFEMAEFLGTFGDYTPGELKELSEAMPVVISRTVEQSMMLPVRRTAEGEGVVRNPAAYSALARRIASLLDETRPQRAVTILSFNYDLGLELALQAEQHEYTNALTDPEQRLAVLKLHGSIAWYRCACGELVDFSRRRYNWSDTALRNINIRQVPMEITKPVQAGQFFHCKGKPHEGPVIVPPIWNKMRLQKGIFKVWSQAAYRFRSAETVIAIGYSLPQTDAFFRYLYALGSVGEVPLRRFWVINSDTSGEVEARFASMLGRGSENRFQYFPMTLEQCLQEGVLDAV
jgi:NAD-dependent SIR2 family protein deacetylase